MTTHIYFKKDFYHIIWTKKKILYEYLAENEPLLLFSRVKIYHIDWGEKNTTNHCYQLMNSQYTPIYVSLVTQPYGRGPRIGPPKYETNPNNEGNIRPTTTQNPTLARTDLGIMGRVDAKATKARGGCTARYGGQGASPSDPGGRKGWANLRLI